MKKRISLFCLHCPRWPPQIAPILQADIFRIFLKSISRHYSRKGLCQQTQNFVPGQKRYNQSELVFYALFFMIQYVSYYQNYTLTGSRRPSPSRPSPSPSFHPIFSNIWRPTFPVLIGLKTNKITRKKLPTSWHFTAKEQWLPTQWNNRQPWFRKHTVHWEKFSIFTKTKQNKIKKRINWEMWQSKRYDDDPTQPLRVKK